MNVVSEPCPSLSVGQLCVMSRGSAVCCFAAIVIDIPVIEFLIDLCYFAAPVMLARAKHLLALVITGYGGHPIDALPADDNGNPIIWTPALNRAPLTAAVNTCADALRAYFRTADSGLTLEGEPPALSSWSGLITTLYCCEYGYVDLTLKVLILSKALLLKQIACRC